MTVLALVLPVAVFAQETKEIRANDLDIISDTDGRVIFEVLGEDGVTYKIDSGEAFFEGPRHDIREGQDVILQVADLGDGEQSVFLIDIVRTKGLLLIFILFSLVTVIVGLRRGVRVVVIDTGIDPGHPDLSVAGGINFTSAKGGKASAWKDDNGHGTHVAGTIAALDNSLGVVGVAPGAELWACKALDRSGSGWLSDIIACLDWAVLNGMQVANMSLGAQGGNESYETACNAAKAAGVVLAAAAGNDGDGNPATDDVDWPGAYASTIAVAATDDTDTVASFSSDGDAVSVAAPGVAILSTYKGGGLAIGDGTSMATPHVAGVAALLIEDYALSPDCVQTLLESSAVDLGDPGRDPFYGTGRIDAAAAYAAAATGCP
ncbi:S8 family peptidase [Patescibacteria group bacterium]